MKRNRYGVVYIKYKENVVLIEETIYAKRKYNDFLIDITDKTDNKNTNSTNQSNIIPNLENSDNLIDSRLRNFPSIYKNSNKLKCFSKPIFKGDKKTYREFKERKAESSSGFRKTIINLLI